MLYRPPACCRAVKRQLSPSYDSIWVSDEILRHAFHRFVNTRIGKRHGSFVPGPLESRRRLGKRRMTHLTESVPTSLHNLGPIWGLFGKAENTQWRWEAPSTRQTSEGSATALPAWLMEWDTSPRIAPELEDIEESTRTTKKQAVLIEEDIGNFPRTLQAASQLEMLEICDMFNQRFKQSLRLGLVSEATMHSALYAVSRAIRVEFSKLGLTDTHYLLRFYQAFWDGLVTCKVLQPVDLNARTLDIFLLYLGKLPICLEVQTLSHGVIHAASVAQLGKMKRGLSRLVRAWAQSWLLKHPSGDPQSSFLAASQDLAESSKRLVRLQSLISNKEANNELEFSTIQEAFKETKESLDRALENILKAENVVLPRKNSIDTLSYILGFLPREHVCRLLDINTDHIIRIHNSVDNPSTNLYHGWLSLVAKIPGVHDKFFVDIIKRMQECKGILQHPLPGEIVLSHWISQGHLRRPDLVRITSEVFASNKDPPDLGLVLYAIDKHREMVFKRTKDLFKLLSDLGRYKDVYKILVRMQSLGLKLPSDIIGPTMNIMSKYDLVLAGRIYNRFYSGLGVSGKCLLAELSPDFIFSMVNDANISPLRIWKVMGIPFYEKMRPAERAAFSKRRLSPGMADFVTALAISFARADARPQRVALRNVVQCLHHLRRHRASITPELTRAISHAGFTRKILAGQWVSKELQSWILGIIEVAEGTDVAVITDSAVTYWNEQLAEKQHEKALKEIREMNVLRVGLID
ncbi:hypothetical protein N431DRAFT_393307 [Stipitochalara longipes BDJ]|nr:hypothetical protein N431DRAFT_393307 [Stipitochalara longipes BDJ]